MAAEMIATEDTLLKLLAALGSSVEDPPRTTENPKGAIIALPSLTYIWTGPAVISALLIYNPSAGPAFVTLYDAPASSPPDPATIPLNGQTGPGYCAGLTVLVDPASVANLTPRTWGGRFTFEHGVHLAISSLPNATAPIVNAGGVIYFSGGTPAP